MIGQSIAHYQIAAKIGEGGMGEVYLATDSKLDRRVALKFLPQALQRDAEARERLLREAKAASRLNHPNIMTVHAVEHVDGRDFIVMEFVEGESLKARFAQGDIETDEIARIALQATEALEEAHKAGVIHRDIKPDNIIVTPQGRVKLMDFGLAVWGGAAKLTQEGSTVGTAAYMSPEQVQGGTVDHRSDLWSLGVVLYEMISGRLPFSGEHQAAVGYSIANENPEPLARYKSGLPDHWQQVVSKLLEKDPQHRYQSAAGLASDLRRLQVSGLQPLQDQSRSRAMLYGIGVAAVAIIIVAIVGYWTFSPYQDLVDSSNKPQRKMLAVLPFENLSASEDEYFADGMTEEITARLAAVRSLGIIARTSILKYKDTEKSIQQIGEELGVDYVLEGTVRWQKSTNGADRVRITPQLIKVADETHLWANVYDAVLDEVFEVQSDVAQKVVAALDVTLNDPEHRSLNAKPTDNLTAYDLYLRGRGYFHKIVGGEDDRALRLAAQVYEEAVATDSSFALAWAALSQIYTEKYWHQEYDSVYLERSRVAMERAMRLQPDLPEAFIARGSMRYHQGDYDGALKDFAIVEDRQPNNSDLMMEIGYVKRRMKKPKEAIAYFHEAMQLDPQSHLGASQAGMTAQWNHQYAVADSYLERVLEIAPDNGVAITNMAFNMIERGEPLSFAINFLKEREDVIDDFPRFNPSLGLLLAWAGRYQESLHYFSKNDDPLHPCGRYFFCADVFELMGNKELAQQYYDSARMVLQVENQSGLRLEKLGLAYVLAGLGRREESLAALKDALASDWYDRDQWAQSLIAVDLVTIYVKLAEEDKALDIIEQELPGPSIITTTRMQLEPRWKPLRDNPRFQKLLAQYNNPS